MKIGSADDSSAITAMLPIGDLLYIIKEYGIYAVKLADSIDPARHNPQIPNIQQRVLAYGSESALVGKTFLTAVSLFNKTYLPKIFECEKAITLSFEALKDVVAMYEAMEAFTLSERTEIEAFNNRQQMHGALVMPAIEDALVCCKTFCQKADHVSQSLFNIVKLFYGKSVEPKRFESLAELVAKKYGEEDSFAKFAKDVAPRLKYLRDVRNCFEHPEPPTQMAIVSDFSLSAEGNISLPMIEVTYKDQHHSPVPISWFMKDAVDGLSGIFETMLAYLCSKNVPSFDGLPVHVIELPTERRQQDKKHVRFSYGIQINGEMIPAG